MSDNRYDRFLYDTLSKFQGSNHNALFDYENFPVLKLEDAVQEIIPQIPDIKNYVEIAKKKCNRRSTMLSSNESAAIYLYTMPIPLFSLFNNALRSENRQVLEPWFAFLKLFMTALKKLPSMKGTVWRGTSNNVDPASCSHDTCILWPVTSCSMNFETLKLLLGEKGYLFAIDAINGKDISGFSAFPIEQEIILMPGTHVRDKCLRLTVGGLVVVHLEEIDPQE